jgi:hypothetical protein
MGIYGGELWEFNDVGGRWGKFAERFEVFVRI